MSQTSTRERLPENSAVRADRARLLRRLTAALFGVALGAFLALALSPRSHWLVRTQISGWMPPVADSMAETDPGRIPAPISFEDLQRAADRVPDDGEAQAALLSYRLQGRTGPGAHNIASLAQLANRFPNDPAVQAAALRLAWTGGTRPAPRDIPPLLAIARNGQRLDPRNAFFPAMRWGLLSSARQEDKALSALFEAAALPRWNTYLVQQVHGGWRLSDMASGEDNTAGYAEMMAAASIYYAVSFVDAGDAAARAAELREAAGQMEAGYAIRRALLRLGERMRRHDTSQIGSRVGNGVQEAATLYLPDGPKTSRGRVEEHARRNAFDAYLRRTGHADALPWLAQQYAAHDAADRVVGQAMMASVHDRLMPFSGWYRAGAGLLRAVMWLGIVALFAALLARWRWANTLVGGFREAAGLCVVAVSLLLLAYGVVSLQTLRAATQTNRTLTEIVQNEPRFYATLTGISTSDTR